ncbi:MULTISPECIES: NAD-dependent protein deacylase [unclassified Enterococcus]|jgi:NAD-dependent deacetylase|uniref:NAD-dependent protein deacylase n=1 Tax=unclassified Enterococcus TaxID=2608891 RepID=UPI003D2979B2
MKRINPSEAAAKILSADRITFLTGAGVSTPSGIPDYRSLDGVYRGMERPEYLLSRQALLEEPQKFYTFIKHLYHPDAEPNLIHQTIAQLEKEKTVWTISQNIDGLHRAAGTSQLIEFHGNLYNCTCMNCGKSVDWQEYLQSDRHNICGGQIRPMIVLYGEGFQPEVIEQAVEAVSQAELIVIIGTSFQVYPFRSLIEYKQKEAEILVINQTEIDLDQEYFFAQYDGIEVFEQLNKGAENDKN